VEVRPGHARIAGIVRDVDLPVGVGVVAAGAGRGRQLPGVEVRPSGELTAPSLLTPVDAALDVGDADVRPADAVPPPGASTDIPAAPSGSVALGAVRGMNEYRNQCSSWKVWPPGSSSAMS
jgi:hypothetical protein